MADIGAFLGLELLAGLALWYLIRPSSERKPEAKQRPRTYVIKLDK